MIKVTINQTEFGAFELTWSRHLDLTREGIAVWTSWRNGNSTDWCAFFFFLSFFFSTFQSGVTVAGNGSGALWPAATQHIRRHDMSFSLGLWIIPPTLAAYHARPVMWPRPQMNSETCVVYCHEFLKDNKWSAFGRLKTNLGGGGLSLYMTGNWRSKIYN